MHNVIQVNTHSVFNQSRFNLCRGSNERIHILRDKVIVCTYKLWYVTISIT